MNRKIPIEMKTTRIVPIPKEIMQLNQTKQEQFLPNRYSQKLLTGVYTIKYINILKPTIYLIPASMDFGKKFYNSRIYQNF